MPWTTCARPTSARPSWPASSRASFRSPLRMCRVGTTPMLGNDRRETLLENDSIPAALARRRRWPRLADRGRLVRLAGRREPLDPEPGEAEDHRDHRVHDVEEGERQVLDRRDA